MPLGAVISGMTLSPGCFAWGVGMIELFTGATPNGQKVSCALEELGLAYETRAIDFSAREQKSDWFTAINPNGRIPAIIDHGAEGVQVFESGAILIYLAEKAGALLPPGGQARARVLGWLMFQMGGVGPMMGQAHTFLDYMPEKMPLAIERYQNETRRLFEVLDRRLGESEWLGDDYSIADIANWSWVRASAWAQVPHQDFANLDRWVHAIARRPAIQRGIRVPTVIEGLPEIPIAG